MRDTMREDARLPRARAGDDEQRPLGVPDRLELGFVEAVEEALGGCDRDQPMLAAGRAVTDAIAAPTPAALGARA
jgi:hypothetical protein